MHFIVYRLPVLLYMGLIFYESSGPIESPALEAIPDTVLHAAGYTVLYLLAFWAVHEGLAVAARRGGYWLPAMITVLYGASDEFHQSYVPGRVASLHDLAADAAGAVLGILLVAVLRRLYKKKREGIAP